MAGLAPLKEERSLEVIPLGPGFAAEIRGNGMAEVAASDDIYAAVRSAFEEHSVLLFRRQTTSNELQAAFSRKFGPLEIAKAASRGEGTPFSILTNVEPDGTLVTPDTKRNCAPVPISCGIHTAASRSRRR